ncbi:hypothetical protein E2562_023184 [Oryza meyeriana var. granulata]|uniref:Uncharacterized protein n=1 Tax=Oryza meyeriana var. granulata TaxID=110450 RepID=A0A6G1BZU4_9ORYZ|nr:hypothetical protein E2562_023184 [Oryza meyeriana var. granulata]
MDPEMMRVAQEQMSRMSPADLAAMQQQLMSNPSLLRFASESIKNLSADDIRRAGRQLNQTRPEEMLDMSRKLAGASPDELAAMKVQAEQRISHVYAEAAAKYRLAKDNLKNVPSQDAQSLQTECVDEVSEVLAYDPSNVKAYYRRGQAYRELGNLEAAVADMRKAHELSPDEVRF